MKHSSTEADQLASLRVPPQSIESESSVLGAMLLDNNATDLIADVLTESDFYRPEHRSIFRTIGKLVQGGSVADVITVYEALKNTGNAEAAGGLQYLNSLAQYVPSAANIRRYAETVREKSILRNLIAVSDQTINDAFALDGRVVQNVLEDAEQRVLAIGESGLKRAEVKTLDGQVTRAIDWLQNRADHPNERTGVMSGFEELDNLTGGFQAGDLVVIAGRPSMGKTSLAMNIAENASLNQHLPVLVNSLETEADQLTRRSLGSVGRVSQERLKNGNLTDDDWKRVMEAMEKMRGHVLDVLDDGASTIPAFRSKARRAARIHGKLGLIVLDYLQLMEPSEDGKPENRATEVARISRALKLLAKELKCPVIALSQLNRGLESRPDKRPLMSDLRESGAIEQDADVIIFIYRDEYYTKSDSKEPGVAEVIVAKQRNGPTGTVKLAWQKEYTRFESLARC